ncbi:efflux RND transporter periplasmic adaptor subunit [Rhodovulum sp. PH10]|uniref:efflux RND transporter periplasmic adaptor subunit n=1 Tax=Rhodovulum sp. PH10 TaxID=1187851 RepID=UPI00058EE09F|nr:efflux RND transporter periplasmic adaptor subunit [Rhodovulum sp. PH10]
MATVLIRTAFLLLLLLLLVVGGAVGVARAAEEPAGEPAGEAPGKPVGKAATEAAAKGVPVIVTRAKTACFSSAVHANGLFVARAEAMVVPEQEGFRIGQVLARPGDTVTAGQPVARLTRADGAGTTLRAPVDGLVIESNAVLGALASPRAPDPLFRIALDGEIELTAEVPSLYLPKIEPGQTARVEFGDGRDIPGRVRLVPTEINPVSQLGPVRISIENDPSLKIGGFARATIDAARSCGVSVPRAAVHFRTEGATVQVVKDRTVETRTVKVGLVSGQGAEIRDGVAEGEVVIANAGGSLRDGDKVRPMVRDDTTGQLEEP